MKEIYIESDSYHKEYYRVTLVNGVSLSCTCPGFAHHQYCKHLEIGDLHDSFMKSKYKIMKSLGISEEMFKKRYQDTVNKYKRGGVVKYRVAAVRRVIEYAASLPDDNRCQRCDGSGIIIRFLHINGGKCFRCNGSGMEPGSVVKSAQLEIPTQSEAPIQNPPIVEFCMSLPYRHDPNYYNYSSDDPEFEFTPDDG